MQRLKIYLVQVMKKGTHCKTMDELWYIVYHQSKVTSLDELPHNKLFIEGTVAKIILFCFYAR